MDIKTINNVLEQIDSDTEYVIWDLDTLIKGSTTLGSSEWCYQISNHNTVQEILDSLDTICALVQYKPIEQSTIHVLETIEQNSIKQYFISPRGMRHYSYILKQIKDAGLSEIINENDIVFFEELEHSKLEAIKSIKPKVKNFIYVSKSADDLESVSKLKCNVTAIHYELNQVYDKNDAIRDLEQYKQIKMFEQHINRKLNLSFLNFLNMTLMMSILWWWVYRFAGL